MVFSMDRVGESWIVSVYYYLCYEGNVDLDAIADLNERHALEVQIMEFGQIPKQVFRVPHPRRKVGMRMLLEPDQIVREKDESEGIGLQKSSQFQILQLKSSYGISLQKDHYIIEVE